MKGSYLFLLTLSLYMGVARSQAADTLRNELRVVEHVQGQTLVLEGNTTLRITGDSTALSGATIHINSPDAYVFLSRIGPEKIKADLSQYFLFSGETMKLFSAKEAVEAQNAGLPDPTSNALVRQYYTFGTAITAYRDQDNQPALIGWSDYEATEGETSFRLGFHRGEDARLLNGKWMRAFTLKRGYMAVLARATRTSKPVGQANSQEEGPIPFWEISYSRVFGAIEGELHMELEDQLADQVTFIMVQPWSWASKKGLCTSNQRTAEMQGDWYYNWGLGNDFEDVPAYAPMTWGRGRIARNDLWDQFTGMGPVYAGSLNHLMAFNEPDHPGQADMEVAEAVGGWPRFLETGARLLSPSVTEGGHNQWLPAFYDDCKDLGYRVDAIGVHWYDWGNWSSNQNPNADPEGVFRRFKNYLASRHAQYGMPLWITEFNANKNRYQWVHREFLKKALPYLDSLPYVERYAFFEPNGDRADFFDSVQTNQLTPVGIVYQQHASVPAIGDSVYYGHNNLPDGTFTRTPTGNATGVWEPPFPSFEMYPNPAWDRLMLPKLPHSTQISIADLQGKIIRKHILVHQHIPVDSLSPGAYLLIVEGYPPQLFLKR